MKFDAKGNYLVRGIEHNFNGNLEADSRSIYTGSVSLQSQNDSVLIVGKFFRRMGKSVINFLSIPKDYGSNIIQHDLILEEYFHEKRSFIYHGACGVVDSETAKSFRNIYLEEHCKDIAHPVLSRKFNDSFLELVEVQ